MEIEEGTDLLLAEVGCLHLRIILNAQRKSLFKAVYIAGLTPDEVYL